MQAAREVYTLDDLRHWPVATAGCHPPLRLAVIGDPVAHSASPPMHNAALVACGIEVRYTRLHIKAEALPEALRRVMEAGFVGVNVTLPHKTAILPLLDEIDPLAATLGAVNTVRVEGTGRLRGFNTDGPGFARAVRAAFGVDLRDLHVLILGAGGGAGRAVAAQCALDGCRELQLVNRTAEKAQALAHSLSSRWPDLAATAVPWETKALQRALGETDLIVNASSVGLHDADGTPIPAGMLSAGARVFDTVYRRDGSSTALVAAAHDAGALTAGGLALLLHQGALAFEHWFDRPAPLDAMRAALAVTRPAT